jgi:ribosomal protein S12 methylthiotransferase accessory factor YcaO
MRHHPIQHVSPMRRGVALACCGLALGAASVVALVNALYEMVE